LGAGNAEKNAMSFRGVADSEQIAILTRVLDDYCREHGIEKGDPKREAFGCHIMAIFNSGLRRVDEIRATLAGYRQAGMKSQPPR
jgi:hypothetical protein